jgi:hypothetical protein
MTMLHELYEADDNQNDRRDFAAGREKLVSRNRKSENRSRRGPVSVNGLHRRSNKKFGW